jgi:hypothetical protein
VKPLGFVDALARLLSDSELRTRFSENRAAVVTEFGLEKADAELLSSLDVETLNRQAQGLLLKRQSEVADHMPFTWKRLAGDGPRLFQEYAQQASWPEGHRRHLLDTQAFFSFLKKAAVDRIVKSELKWIQFLVSGRRMAVAFVGDVGVDERRTVGLQVLIRNRHGRSKRFFFCLRRLASFKMLWQRLFCRGTTNNDDHSPTECDDGTHSIPKKLDEAE